MSLFKILFLSKLGTYGQILIPTRSVEHKKERYIKNQFIENPNCEYMQECLFSI